MLIEVRDKILLAVTYPALDSEFLGMRTMVQPITGKFQTILPPLGRTEYTWHTAVWRDKERS